MASRFYSSFRAKKVANPRRGPNPGLPAARTPTGSVTETTATWPDPGPHGPASFNRATQVPVVKTEAVKKGLP